MCTFMFERKTCEKYWIQKMKKKQWMQKKQLILYFFVFCFFLLFVRFWKINKRREEQKPQNRMRATIIEMMMDLRQNKIAIRYLIDTMRMYPLMLHIIHYHQEWSLYRLRTYIFSVYYIYISYALVLFRFFSLHFLCLRTLLALLFRILFRWS